MKGNFRHSTNPVSNISKVKYHLPGSRPLHERKNSNSQLYSQNQTRKHSIKSKDHSGNKSIVFDFLKGKN